MKKTIYLISILAMLFSCVSKHKTSKDLMSDLREEAKNNTDNQKVAVYSWEDKIEMLYNLSDSNLQLAVNYADSIIENNESIDKWKISNLHTIVGEIYYENDSIELAMKRFETADALTFDSPRNKANKAGCYIKKNDYQTAMHLLEQAAEINYDFKWYIGNLFEIMGEPESAIKEYDYLYKRDTIIYQYCNQRIKELNKNPTQLMQELFYKDRRKSVVLKFKVTDPEDEGTKIGEIEIEERQY